MDLTPKLISIFQIVNDLLKFAEAKNAILLAFSGAGITAIITYLSTETSKSNSLLQMGLIIAICLLGISSLISSLSLLPKTDIDRLTWLKTKPSRKNNFILKDTDNLYFFNDIKKYQSSELLESINRLYFENKLNKPYRKEDLDVATQIIINSEIASIKFMFFRVALWFLILSILVIPILFLFSILIYKKVAQ